MIQSYNRDNFHILNWLDEFMVGHNGFICGGCFKNIFNHEKCKDLDIFFENKNDFDDAVKWFDSMTPGFEGEDKREEKYNFYYENDNVKAYKHMRTGILLELNRKIFGKPESILKQFDFTITKFAYYKALVEDETGAEVENSTNPFDIETVEQIPETHIEYKVMYDDKFFEHLHLKRLVTDDQVPFPMSTFERMLRYAKYGYFPCKETKMKIINAIRKLPEREVKFSNNLYNGMD